MVPCVLVTDSDALDLPEAGREKNDIRREKGLTIKKCFLSLEPEVAGE
jgi:hypothetical protein